MKHYSLIVLFGFLGFFFFGFSPFVSAQIDIMSLSSVSVNMAPENPGPNQTVNVSLESYSDNLDSAMITWKINDKIEKKGIGLKKFTFSTGNENVNVKLDILVQTAEGQEIRNTYNIRPASVDLIWQTDGFVPPFFKGKTLFSHQNKIQFVAIPHITGQGGQEIPPGNLIYRWTRNGTVIGDSSGYGRNVFTMTGSIISRPLEVEVEVTSPNSGGSGKAVVTVRPIEPEIVMYEKNPLYGIQFQKALVETVSLGKSREITVVGIPLFFGVIDKKDLNLQYKWKLNGTTINNGTDPSVRVFRQEEKGAGISYISLSVENGLKVLQYASSGFNLVFGE